MSAGHDSCSQGRIPENLLHGHRDPKKVLGLVRRTSTSVSYVQNHQEPLT